MPSTSLRQDARGAVMLIAVFMAMIAIGALYYVVGLGDAMVAQERMQDAADASAFSSAVVHARGMNLLALLNIVMASVLAVLVLLAMLGSLLSTAAKILALASFLVPGLAGGVKILSDTAKVVQLAEERAKPAVERVLIATHKLQRPLAVGIPIIASINAAKLSSQSYAPVVTVGTTFPIVGRLPTALGSFDTLCLKAGAYAGEMAIVPINAVLEEVPGAGFIAKRMRKYAKTLGRTYARFYCGSGPMPKPPRFPIEVAIPEINSPERVTCESGEPGDACERYAKQQQDVQAAYQFEHARCQSEDAQTQNACEQVRRRARRECQPHKDLVSTTWVERELVHTYAVVGKGKSRRVVKEDTIIGKGRKMSMKHKFAVSSIPCGLPGVLQGPFSDWQLDPGKPLCTEEHIVPRLGDFIGTDRLQFTVTEIPDVAFCVVEKEVESKLSAEPMAEELKSNTPQEMCNCAALGEDMFQVRSVVLGDARAFTSESDKAILVATMGKEAPRSTLKQLASFAGHVSAAQAEYYFDGDKQQKALDPSEWLWHMHWKARMRRLSFARRAWHCPEEKNTCEQEAGVLESMLPEQRKRIGAFTTQLKEGMDAVIVH